MSPAGALRGVDISAFFVKKARHAASKISLTHIGLLSIFGIPESDWLSNLKEEGYGYSLIITLFAISNTVISAGVI